MKNNHRNGRIRPGALVRDRKELPLMLGRVQLRKIRGVWARTILWRDGRECLLLSEEDLDEIDDIEKLME
jgi:hypothetical protein